MTTLLPSVHDEVERLQARVETLEHERKHLLAVIEILQEIGGSLHFVDVVQAVARRLGETFGLDRCSIFLGQAGDETVRLVASYEDPSIRNYVVDLARYPELRRALASGQTVYIADATSEPDLRRVRAALLARRVQSITVVPIVSRGRGIGAIYLRTFRDGPAFSDADLEFCRVVASLTARSLRNALRFERLQARVPGGADAARREGERVALLGFLHRMLDTYAEREGPLAESVLAKASSEEIDRLVEVAMEVVAQEATGA
jgi:GAF domain-containing protein